MEAIPKSVIKSDIKFDISIKLTTWIGHKRDSSLWDLCTMTLALASKQAPVSFCLWPKALIDHVKHHEKSHKLPALQTNQ